MKTLCRHAPRAPRKIDHSKRNEKGETKLQEAAIKNNIDLVKQLIKDGASVNVYDFCGWTPLHEACNHGHVAMVELLLSVRNIDVNHTGGARECGLVT